MKVTMYESIDTLDNSKTYVAEKKVNGVYFICYFDPSVDLHDPEYFGRTDKYPWEELSKYSYRFVPVKEIWSEELWT